MPQQVCNIFQWSAFHSQTARKCMSQVVPTKVLDLRFGHRVVEPMPPIFERLPGLRRLEHTPFAFAGYAQPSGRQPQNHLAGRVLALRSSSAVRSTSDL
jgi:hypothetical protein